MAHGIKRLANEHRTMCNPEKRVCDYYAEPLEDNIYEWHFTIRGPATNNKDVPLPYKDGIYHGMLTFPMNYPFEPPDIYFFTPNGRFKLNTKICSSISSFHKELWRPTFDIGLILVALRLFMGQEDEIGVGGMFKTSLSEKDKLDMAQKSWQFECPTCKKKVKEIWESEMKPYPSTTASRIAEVPQVPPSASPTAPDPGEAAETPSAATANPEGAHDSSADQNTDVEFHFQAADVFVADSREPTLRRWSALDVGNVGSFRFFAVRVPVLENSRESRSTRATEEQVRESLLAWSVFLLNSQRPGTVGVRGSSCPAPASEAEATAATGEGDGVPSVAGETASAAPGEASEPSHGHSALQREEQRLGSGEANDEAHSHVVPSSSGGEGDKVEVADTGKSPGTAAATAPVQSPPPPFVEGVQVPQQVEVDVHDGVQLRLRQPLWYRASPSGSHVDALVALPLKWFAVSTPLTESERQLLNDAIGKLNEAVKQEALPPTNGTHVSGDEVSGGSGAVPSVAKDELTAAQQQSSLDSRADDPKGQRTAAVAAAAACHEVAEDETLQPQAEMPAESHSTTTQSPPTPLQPLGKPLEGESGRLPETVEEGCTVDSAAVDAVPAAAAAAVPAGETVVGENAAQDQPPREQQQQPAPDAPLENHAVLLQAQLLGVEFTLDQSVLSRVVVVSLVGITMILLRRLVFWMLIRS